MPETQKAEARRIRDGFFDKYCQGKGLDIGSGSRSTLPAPVQTWDKVNGDAVYLEGIEDESFDFVYSSHCLEHLDRPDNALRNWFRVVKRGGFLIICVPHRDLYEKQQLLPSRWNGEHKSYWLPGTEEPPHTIGLKQFICRQLPIRIVTGENGEKERSGDYEIIYCKTCDEGWTPVPFEEHSHGEYQIECVIRKV